MKTRLLTLLAIPLTLALLLSPVHFQTQSAATELSTGAYYSRTYANLFRELLGLTDDAIQDRLDYAWERLFYGNNETERVYYPICDDMGYILDVDTLEIKSEGMSYGMMIAVQMDRKAEFDRLWKFAKKKMQHRKGARSGYFAWRLNAGPYYKSTCADDPDFDMGDPDFVTVCIDSIDEGSKNPASDGDEWIAMALFFAAGRWGNGVGIYDYQAEAQAILDAMLLKEDDPQHGDRVNMFNMTEKQVVFVPYDPQDPHPPPSPASFTNPSYHLPAFYELWALWADKKNDFWRDAAGTSRQFFANAASEKGLTPDYAQWDGEPYDPWNEGHDDFCFDAWRVAMNVAVDYAWFAKDSWQVTQSDTLLNFFHGDYVWNGGKYGNQYELDGTPLTTTHSIGLVAMNAVAGLASTTSNTRDFVLALWDSLVPSGDDRYYNGMLYMLGMLHASGNFRIYDPTRDPTSPRPDRIDVALVIDSSGSMQGNDPEDLRKEAARVFIDAMQGGDQIAIVDFDDDAQVLWNLQSVGSDREGAKAALDGIDSYGGTNIGAGLQSGFVELESSTVNSSKAALLLTDGDGGYTDQADEYAKEGWQIFTIGLGTAPDEMLLQDIACGTCGHYYELSVAEQMVSVYFDILNAATGSSVLFNETTSLQQGETQEFSVTLPSPGVTTANFLVTWPGSTVELTLKDPDGHVITPEIASQDPAIDRSQGATFELYRITFPEPGDWKMQIFGADISASSENVEITVAVRGMPQRIVLPLVVRNHTPSPPINHPPSNPSGPTPADGATNQATDVNMAWIGGDPDGDSVTYDVYFEANDSTPEVLTCNDVANTSCDPGALDSATHYYWQVVAEDEYGATTTGPVWDFTTLLSGWHEVGIGSAGNGGISDNNGASTGPSVALASDGTVYIAWTDDSSGKGEIYVLSWDGTNWQEVGAGSASGGGISNSSGNSSQASIALAPDGTPYVAWRDDSSGHINLYVRHWNGTSWEEVGAGSATGGGVTNTSCTSASTRNSIAVGADGVPYVIWDEDCGWPEIFVRRWNGATWEAAGTGADSGRGISNTPYWYSYEPVIEISPDNIPYAVWHDDGFYNRDYDIYARRLIGDTWEEIGAGSASGAGIISPPEDWSAFGTVAFAPGGTPYVAWQDESSGDYEAYVRRWNGTNWEEVGTGSASGGGISNNDGISNGVALAVAPDGTPYVAWQDQSSGDYEVYVRRWNGTNWKEVGTGSATGGGISDNDGSSTGITIAVDPTGIPYVAWGDNSSGDYEVYVMRWLE